MLRIWKISGQELPAVGTEKICDIHGLKLELRVQHYIPVCLQQLLHKGSSLDDSTELDTLKHGNKLNDSTQPGLLDASIHLQLVLAKPSAAAELKETEVFRDACWRGELEAAQLLLHAGAEKDLQDSLGTTALMVAASEGRTKVAHFLLHAGADKDVQDHQGSTALMAAGAARSDHAEIAQLLLQAGADKDLQDSKGATALMVAASNGRTEMAQMLLQAGAAKDLRDKEGTTALMAAARKGHTEIAQLLLQAGADKDLQDNSEGPGPDRDFTVAAARSCFQGLAGQPRQDSSHEGSLQRPQKDRTVAAASR